MPHINLTEEITPPEELNHMKATISTIAPAKPKPTLKIAAPSSPITQTEQMPDAKGLPKMTQDCIQDTPPKCLVPGKSYMKPVKLNLQSTITLPTKQKEIPRERL